MKILYVDTTTADLIVALVEDNKISDFSRQNLGTRHSETLCNCVADALSRSGLSFNDLDAYACAVGPGSFTGIRIGISTLKGYCLAVDKPLISVNCLEAISNSAQCGKKGRAVIDAGNGYYFADYLIENAAQPCLVPYDGDCVKGCGTASVGSQYLDGAVDLVRRKFAKKEFVMELEPCYIRRSQAEEK